MNATVSTKQFQVFGDTIVSQNVYRAMPQLDVNWYQNDVGPFDTRIYGQAVHFTNVSNAILPEATRVHLEPTLNLPLSNDWASLNTEAKLMATHYQQDIPDGFAADYYRRKGIDTTRTNQLKESVNRTLPQFKVDGRLVFERDMNWAEGYTQTLEPRVQYLYVPYRDQSNIYTYDSTLLQSDYSGLFRDRTYGGLDRIASANQVTTGVTTRIYDDAAAVERFNVSVGQIYYFTESRTGADETIGTGIRERRYAVAWFGRVIPTGVSPIVGACAVACSTTPVWTTSPRAMPLWNTVGMKTVWCS